MKSSWSATLTANLVLFLLTYYIYICTMTVYEAIRQMRQLTARNQSFALSYMTYSMQRHESHGEVVCEHALLVKNPRPTSSSAMSSCHDDFTCQDFMLTYRDQDTGEARHFWQPLLLSFNHQLLTSID